MSYRDIINKIYKALKDANCWFEVTATAYWSGFSHLLRKKSGSGTTGVIQIGRGVTSSLALALALLIHLKWSLFR